MERPLLDYSRPWSTGSTVTHYGFQWSNLQFSFNFGVWKGNFDLLQDTPKLFLNPFYCHCKNVRYCSSRVIIACWFRCFLSHSFHRMELRWLLMMTQTSKNLALRHYASIGNSFSLELLTWNILTNIADFKFNLFSKINSEFTNNFVTFCLPNALVAESSPHTRSTGYLER